MTETYPMAITELIPPERLEAYFDDFTRRYLRDGSPEAIDVEFLADDLGDQHPIEGARLSGITYDPRDNALEFALESGDHRVYSPKEVWAIEEPAGFPRTIEVVRPDGAKEIVTLKSVGLRPLR
jgi:hypothetical protein